MSVRVLKPRSTGVTSQAMARARLSVSATHSGRQFKNDLVWLLLPYLMLWAKKSTEPNLIPTWSYTSTRKNQSSTTIFTLYSWIWWRHHN